MSRKRITVFGAGRVAAPALEYLLRSYQVTLVDADVSALATQQERFAGADLVTERSDIGSPAAFAFVAGSACVLSLLPPGMHVAVARECLRERVPFVTTSYASEEMRSLDRSAVEAGIAILNECGLDPGIDHMLAMRSIDSVHQQGGTIRSFVSQCGGIPAEPDVNPLGYKVSWSPAGVISAARQGARYVEDGRIREVPAEEVFATAHRLNLAEMPELEAFYNRDSVEYAATYGVLNETRFFARMTLRYPGWCDTFAALTKLGALRDDVLPADAVTSAILEVPEGENFPRTAVARRLQLPSNDPVLDRLEWLGLFSRERLGNSSMTKSEALVTRMAARLRYDVGEMDRIVLRHEVQADYPNGRSETETALLLLDGAPGGFSAMARTVGVPAAAAASLLAEDRVRVTGVHIPTVAALYQPILDILASEQLVPTITTLPKRF